MTDSPANHMQPTILLAESLSIQLEDYGAIGIAAAHVGFHNMAMKPQERP
jgi:hypothetical protein